MSIEKVVVNYNSESGEITDKNGVLVCVWAGLQSDKVQGHSGVDELIKLKNAGFTTDEIIELRRKELI